MRSRFLMIVSLIVLGIGLLGILYIKATSSNTSQSSPAVDATSETPPEVFYTIWTAKHQISMGDQISRDDLRIEKIPQAEAFEYGIKQDIDISFVDGMVATEELPVGSPILSEKIIYPDQDGYFNFLIEPGYVPVPLSVPKLSSVSGVISSGSLVDVLVLTSSTQNLVGRPQIRDLDSISLAPLFIGVKVLQVIDSKNTDSIAENISPSSDESSSDESVTLILQLTRKQVAKLTIARNIAQIEVHLSTGEFAASELSADSGDILSDYKSVRELRARNEIVQ